MARKKTKQELINDTVGLLSSLTQGQLEEVNKVCRFVIRACMEMEHLEAGLAIVPREGTLYLEKMEKERKNEPEGLKS